MVRVTHHSRGIYRTRGETRALKEAVLDAWSTGQDGDEVALISGIPRSYVHSLVRRARLAGDPRAALKRTPYRVGEGLSVAARSRPL